MNDINCPYCGAEQEINHDDGFGYDEGELHQQDCTKCEKTFGFTTCISFDYEAYATPCLNDEAEHIWKKVPGYPEDFKRMRCTVCEEEITL